MKSACTCSTSTDVLHVHVAGVLNMDFVAALQIHVQVHVFNQNLG